MQTERKRKKTQNKSHQTRSRYMVAGNSIYFILHMFASIVKPIQYMWVCFPSVQINVAYTWHKQMNNHNQSGP